MSEIEEKEMNEAKEYLSYWQRELRLDHMDIYMDFFRPEEETAGVLGTCKCAPSYHCQRILLRNPLDRTELDRTDFQKDLEVTIVHELLHTKEFPWRDHPEVEKAMSDPWIKQRHEDSLDAVAEALVRTRRGIKR
jgi:hypothetical protein